MKRFIAICSLIVGLTLTGCTTYKQENRSHSETAEKILTQDFIIERLLTIDEISGVEAVTEDNDPNGHLNKPGGYISAIYFSSINVNQSDVLGDSIVDRGTDGGGCIEVFTTVDDAKKRDEHLACFDGGMFDSGSHTVVETMVIRTSSNLTATHQQELEEKIIIALGITKVKTNNIDNHENDQPKTLQEKRTEIIENISIDIPINWRKRTISNNIYYYTPEDDFLMVQTSDVEYELDEFFFNNILDSALSAMSNTNIINKGFSTINSQKFFTAEFTATLSNTEVLSNMYVTKTDNKVYIFTMTCTSQEPKHMDIMREIIDSFKSN